MLIEEIVHITFDETNQKVQDESKNTTEDDETERIQREKETAAEQNEEQTTEVKTGEKEIDSTHTKSVCLRNGEF